MRNVAGNVTLKITMVITNSRFVVIKSLIKFRRYVSGFYGNSGIPQIDNHDDRLMSGNRSVVCEGVLIMHNIVYT